MNAGVYARVSTARQATEDKTSIADQLRRGQQICAARGWTWTAYVDPGVTGEALGERPELQRLLEDATAGLVDVVVVTGLDRLARDEWVFASIFRVLDACEVPVCEDGRIRDGTDDGDRTTRGVQAVISAAEKRRLVKKMAAGQRAKALAGGWPGGAAPYGYRLAWPDRQCQVEQDPAEVEVIRRAVSMLVDEGLSTGEACVRLNGLGYRTRGGVGRTRTPSPWRHQNLRRVLSSRTLLGEVIWGAPTLPTGEHRTRLRRDGSPRYGEPVRIQLDPILDEGRFTALQRALAITSTGSQRAAQVYPCSGAVSLCGGRLGGVYRRDRGLRQYRCDRAKWSADGRVRCGCPRVDADWLDGQVWGQVVRCLADPAWLQEMAALWTGPVDRSELESVEAKIRDLERSLQVRVGEYLRAGVAAEVVAAVSRDVEAELAALRGYQRTLRRPEVDVACLASAAGHRLPGLGPSEQREVLSLLSVRVTLLGGGRLRIEGVIPGNPVGVGPQSHFPGVTGGDLPFLLR